MVAFVAEKVSELESEDTDVGGEKQEKTEMFSVGRNCLLASDRNN